MMLRDPSFREMMRKHNWPAGFADAIFKSKDRSDTLRLSPLLPSSPRHLVSPTQHTETAPPKDP